MSLDETINTKENFYFIHVVDPKHIYVFYFIVFPRDDFELFLDSVYGAHMKAWDKDKPWNPEDYINIMFINLKTPYFEKYKEYRVRELVATVVHELIHAIDESLTEGQVWYLERLLLIKGYKYSRIKVYK